MEVTRIAVERFKRIEQADISLSAINILVGGNNSGKSSILEGIHFSAVAALAASASGAKTITQESLLFCPTKDFESLRNGGPYRNQSNFGYLRIYSAGDEQESSCTIRIYRGRNEGNVGCEVLGSPQLRRAVQSEEPPFSVYVPGLSGIPQTEECRTESVVRRGVASGDANLYLRNVLLLIDQSGKLQELSELVQSVFPDLRLYVEFDPRIDIHISVRVSLTGPNGKRVPLELVGTGVQQALQIFSYVALFRPSVLLLDEPDSHLHPNNQAQLAKSMLTISAETDTKIIATTHSRHLVDSLYDEANIVWLREGVVYNQGEAVSRIPLLMDLGALDSFERLREGGIDWAILTEDASYDLVDTLLKSSGFDPEEYVIYSYKSSSNMQSALLLAEFIAEIAPKTSVLIHRDRDMMTDQEVQWVVEDIEAAGAETFITEGCDIESYFVNPEHVASLLGVGRSEVEEWLDELATKNHIELQHRYTRKRDEAKWLYRNRAESPPDTASMLGAEVPLAPDKRLGKFMLRKARGSMHERFGRHVDLRTQSEYLRCERLVEMVNQ